MEYKPNVPLNKFSSGSSSSRFNVKYLGKLLLRKIYIIAFFCIIGIILALSFVFHTFTISYQTSVTFYAIATDGDDLSESYSLQSYAQRAVSTYILLLDTNVFYNDLSEELSQKYTPEQLRSMVSFSAVASSELFKATVHSTDSNTAKLVAEAVEKTVLQFMTPYLGGIKLKVIDPAIQPTPSAYPSRIIIVFVGFFFSFLLAVVFIVTKERLGGRINDGDDLQTEYNIPILAEVLWHR